MGTVVGDWRLKAILILTVTVILIYMAYGMFSPSLIAQSSGGYINEEGYIVYNTTGLNATLGYNESDVNIETSQSFTDAIFGMGEFLTFSDVGNIWAQSVLVMFISICWIVIGYLIYTFLKEWIPFV